MEEGKNPERIVERMEKIVISGGLCK